MPPKHNDIKPSEKLLKLYQLLTSSSGKHFKRGLAEKFKCSPQTIGRLIEIIEPCLGPDIMLETGIDTNRQRYYQLKPQSAARSLGISSEILYCLSVSRDVAAQFLPETETDRISRAITSLALELGERQSATHLPGQPMTFRTKGVIDYQPHLPLIRTLRAAIDRRQVCTVRYRPQGCGDTLRHYRYAPGRVVVMSGTLYLQGYRLSDGTLLAEKPTTFAVHRITAATPTGEYFTFNAADQDARQFGLNWHPPRRMSVLIAAGAADYVRDRIWSDDQTIENQPDGSLLLTVTTTSEKELKAWAASFCGLAEVIDQPHDM